MGMMMCSACEATFSDEDAGYIDDHEDGMYDRPPTPIRIIVCPMFESDQIGPEKQSHRDNTSCYNFHRRV